MICAAKERERKCVKESKLHASKMYRSEVKCNQRREINLSSTVEFCGVKSAVKNALWGRRERTLREGEIFS